MAALNPAKTKNPPMPMNAVCARPLLTGAPNTMAGRAKIGSARRPPMPNSEKAVSPPTAVSGSMPAVASMRYWTAAPAASPAGRMLVMALPDSWAVITANQPRVLRASRWRPKVQVKWATSATTAAANQTGSSVESRGHAANTSVMLGSTR